MPTPPPILRTTARLLVLASTALCSSSQAAPTPKDFEFFEKQVRPLLVSHCMECHTGDDPGGKLSMESLAGMLTGGLRGPALVPGKPNQSLLVSAIRHNEELKMPPKRKLPTAQRAILTEWVKRGAPWPNAKSAPKPGAKGTPAGKPSGPLFTADQKQFWAFQPLDASRQPAVTAENWVTSPIDRYILAQLEAARLQPAHAATPRAWLRRVSFDLTGLPPSEDDITAFLADDSPTARSRLVDRLLASPAYGERWARHWLDVARYADSNGLDENLCYGNAFRYRDYVVGAFNSDLPYDQFVREQLAGDLMGDDGDPGTRLRRVIATGFLVLGPKMLAEDDPRKMQMDIIDEQIDTIGKTFLGLTLGCARCHDHKFDPIPTADYYALAGILKSTKTMENFGVVAKWNETPLADPATIVKQKHHETKIASAKQHIEATSQTARDAIVAQARLRAGDYLLVASSRWLTARELTGRPPLGGTPEAGTTAGVQIREAETYDRGNAAKTTTGYGQGIGVILNGGKLPNVAEYDMTVKQAGTYRIEFRIAAAESRACRLQVNGAVVQPSAMAHVTGSWNPDTQKWFVEGVARLRKGKNTIRIDCTGPFPHIDKLLIAPSGEGAGKQAAELGTLARSVKDSKSLNTQLIQQWIGFLEATSKAKDSPLAAWHHALAQASTPTPSAGPRIKPLLGKPLAELAAGYSRVFTKADTLWRQELDKNTPKPPTGLDDAELEAIRKLLYLKTGPFQAGKELDPAFEKATVANIKQQRDALAKLAKAKPVLPLAMAVADGSVEDLKVHIRGSYLSLGANAPRGFPRILAGTRQAPLPKKTSGRLELARWMTRADNPLVPRVMANRIWRWHFGHGLVRSTDNFGRLGDRPTHPGLLDWLTSELIRHDWSIKSLHRAILLSSTYAMSTSFNPRAAATDPENRLQWRMDRRRLSAEEVRDSLLLVGTGLDRRLGGSLMTVKNRAYVTGTGHNMKTDVYENTRRSIYQPVVRSALFEVFQAFDFANPSLTSGDRVTTTIAPQALFLMNGELVDIQSTAIANRMLALDGDETSRLKALYRSLLGRDPTTVESEQASTFLSEYRRAVIQDDKNKSDPKDPSAQVSPDVRAWRALCRVLLASTEFVYAE
jgi:hypothetical protein